MKYTGKLYGKVGKEYFPLIEDSEYFDRLKDEHAQMLEALKMCKASLSQYASQHSVDAWYCADKAIKKATGNKG